jgi:hypothetical protein
VKSHYSAVIYNVKACDPTRRGECGHRLIAPDLRDVENKMINDFWIASISFSIRNNDERIDQERNKTVRMCLK